VPPGRAAYRTAEAARAISVSLSTMKKLVAGGTVRSIKIGRMRLIPIEALRELVDGSGDPRRPIGRA